VGGWTWHETNSCGEKLGDKSRVAWKLHLGYPIYKYNLKWLGISPLNILRTEGTVTMIYTVKSLSLYELNMTC